MKKIMVLPALVLTLGSSLLLNSFAFAEDARQGSKEEQEREERIRYNLRQGAFRLNGGIYNKNVATSAGTPSPLKGLSQDQVRSHMQEWGVNYFFQLNETDLEKTSDRPFYVIEDFLGNATAESRGGSKFKAQVCKDDRNDNGVRAAHFSRTTNQDATGGYLLVKESDPTVTNLSPYDGFSMGAWIQLDDRNTNGAFPILSKSAMNQVNTQGRNEWSFWVTGNVVYLNINRQGHTQNLNFNIPWWGDRFGSCYERGVYRECWHYVGLSFDPTVNKVSVLFLRKFANKIPEPMAENFFNHETSAQVNSLAIESSSQTPLRIGGMNKSTMDGILKGVFFAKKALSATELKAMAQFAEPKKDGLFCNQ